LASTGDIVDFPNHRFSAPMPHYIEMPSLSDTMTEGTLLKWLIKPGDTVTSGQVIAEIQTDKATMEQNVFTSGVVHKLYVREGDKVPIGAAMAIILEDGEAPPADDAAPVLKVAAAPAAASAGSGPATARSRAAATAPASRSRGGRVKASPLARKIATERGINLSALEGTGPGGRIVRADVLSAGTNGGSAAPGLPVIRPVVGPDDVRVPLSPIRTIIATRLLASKTQIPHFYLNIEVDAGPLMAFRAQANAAEEARGSGVKFTVNDFILKAAASAASEVPAINASFDVDAIVRFKNVNLAVAIAIDDGLVTPVIPEAQSKSLSEISTAVKDLAKRAKENKLRPDEFANGTLTISNLGAFGIDTFDAIINPPQAAILSIGAIVKKPVVDASGQLAVGQRLWIGMSCDHRVVDGAVGATYLQALRKLIEAPALMLL
jgi:pyruvate dehydrogenase E2 component (dihydrolipoamide acetyltransferase)